MKYLLWLFVPILLLGQVKTVTQTGVKRSLIRGDATTLTWTVTGDYSSDSLLFIAMDNDSNAVLRLTTSGGLTASYSGQRTTITGTIYAATTENFISGGYLYDISSVTDSITLIMGLLTVIADVSNLEDTVLAPIPYYTVALDTPAANNNFIIGMDSNNVWYQKTLAQTKTILGIDTLSGNVNVDLDSLYTKTSHIVNVKEFGAVGDSTTDDTQAIRDAVAFCSGGKTLYIPKGIYRYVSSDLDNEIEMDGLHDITIIGEGKLSIIECSGATARLFDITNTHNLIFDNFTIRGNFTTQTGNNQLQTAIHSDNWITGDTTYNIRIQNMFFDDLAGDAIQFNRATTDVRITNNTWEDGLGFVQLIAGQGLGGFIRPNQNIIIEGNTILASPYSTRDVSGMPSGSDDLVDSWGASEDVIIRNNFFDARRNIADTNGVSRGILIIQNPQWLYGKTRNVLIEGNTLINFHNSDQVYYIQGAIAVESYNYTDSVDMDVVIRGNYIMQGGKGMGIRLYYLQDPTIIENNVVIGCMYGIYVEGNPDDSLMSNNIIRNNYVSGFSRYGLWLDDFGATVKNNEFVLDSLEDGFGYSGLYKSTGDSCSIIGNTFRDGGTFSNAYAGWGIFWGFGNDCRIEDNTFTNLRGGVYIYSDSTTNRLTYKNNYFKNVTTDLTSTHTYDVFDLGITNDDRYYADRYYLGDKEYLKSDGEEIEVYNDAGKITELTHNLAQTTPYELVNETAFARTQADIISGFFSDEIKERQGQILNPTTNDTLSVWLKTTGAIMIDSIKCIADDSARVQIFFGSDSLFNNPELINLDTTISTFDVSTIPAYSRVKLFFLETGDGLSDFNFLIYYRMTGSNSFIKNYLTNIFLDRVTEDGGTIIDTSAISDFYDMMILNGIVDSVTHAWSTTYAVKMDADSNITKLYDLSIYKNDIVQADTTYSPDYKASGISAASFDGDDDYMQLQIEGMEQPETIFLVGKARVQEASSYFYDGYVAQSGALLMSFGGGIAELLVAPTEGGASAFAEDTDILFTASFDGANSSFQINDEVVDACSLNTTAMGGITLGKVGGVNTQTGWAQVNLTEQIILNVNASATLRTAIKTFLNNKYSL